MNDYNEPTLRPAIEIQRAHDMMTAVLLNEELRQALFGSETSLALAIAAADVLCWCLQHTHTRKFEGNLAWIEAVLSLHGYEMADSGKLQKGWAQ